jgi:hypothetical protein
LLLEKQLFSSVFLMGGMVGIRKQARELLTMSAHKSTAPLNLPAEKVTQDDILFGTGLSTPAKYVRRTASGAAGSGFGITIKYLRRTTSAGSRLAGTIKYLRGAAGIGLGITIKYRALCL